MSNRWSKDEEFQLEQLAGDYPWSMVVERYNRWATASGFQPRTAVALARRANILRCGRVPEGEWLTIGAISAILGIDREKPRRWIRWGRIRSKRECNRTPSPHYISRRSLQEWAKRDPAFFRPYPHDALVLLFSCRETADWVYEHPPLAPKTRCRPIRCIQTGRVYRSLTEAAQANYVTVSRIQAIVNTHETVGGHQFVDVAPRYGIQVA